MSKAQTPLVSAIVTTFNRADLVQETIDSILSQDYSNIEIIVVDDYSDDGTFDLLRSYGQLITAILHNCNKGVQVASMTGFINASGDYLCFTGDDDIWHDTKKVSKQVSFFESDITARYGVVASAVEEFGRGVTIVKPRQFPKNLRQHLIKQNGVIYGSSAMIRRSCFELIGGFDPLLIKGTDSDVFRRALLNGWDVHFLAEPLIKYRVGHAKMTANDEIGIRRTISAHLYLLQKYSYIYSTNRKARYSRLVRLARAYLSLYRLNNSESALSGYRKTKYEAFRARPLLSSFRYFKAMFE